MTFRTKFCALLSALVGGPACAQALPMNCLSKEEVELLSSAEGVYFGELHGTQEAPALIECATRSIAELMRPRQRRVLLSLEMPTSALKGEASFWGGNDGRSSWAMYQLITHLSQLPPGAGIELAGHVPSMGAFSDQNDYEARIADILNATSKDLFLVAVGGNFHAAKENIFGDSKISPAGSRLKRKTLHVAIVNGGPSTAWICVNNACDETALGASKSGGGRPQGLYPSPLPYFDYIYVLTKFTSSPPKGAW